MLNVKWFLAFGFANYFRLALAEHLSKIMCTPRHPNRAIQIPGHLRALLDNQLLGAACTVFNYMRCKQSSSKLILVKMNICQGLFDACSTKLLFIVSLVRLLVLTTLYVRVCLSMY